MTDNSRAVVATVVGAVLGGLAGYLFFTDRGRVLRTRMEPMIDDAARELRQFRETIVRAAAVAGDGWRLLNEAISESDTPSPRYHNPHQTSPF